MTTNPTALHLRANSSLDAPARPMVVAEPTTAEIEAFTERIREAYEYDEVDPNRITAEQSVGKTVAAVSTSTVPGAWGDEPVTYLHFTDGTFTGFVHPADEDD